MGESPDPQRLPRVPRSFSSNAGVCQVNDSDGPQGLEKGFALGYDGQYCEKDISGEATSMTVLQICLYIFLFIILPSIILYTIRAVYLMLKRCGVVESPNVRDHEGIRSDRGAIQILALPYHHQPRPAFRTISLPVNATILVAPDSMILLEDGRRLLHRTISWHPSQCDRSVASETSVPPPPPPPYVDTVTKDQV